MAHFAPPLAVLPTVTIPQLRQVDRRVSCLKKMLGSIVNEETAQLFVEAMHRGWVRDYTASAVLISSLLTNLWFF